MSDQEAHAAAAAAARAPRSTASATASAAAANSLPPVQASRSVRNTSVETSDAASMLMSMSEAFDSATGDGVARPLAPSTAAHSAAVAAPVATRAPFAHSVVESFDEKGSATTMEATCGKKFTCF